MASKSEKPVKPPKPAKGDKAPKATAPAKADKAPKPAKASKPAKPGKPGKRPKISYIMVHFEDRPPVVVDPTQVNCLTWDSQGADIIAAYYRSIGRDKEAEAVERMWHDSKPSTSGRAGASSASELPAMLLKHPSCAIDPWP